MPDGTSGPPPAELGLTSKDLGISPDITTRLNEIDSQITARSIHGKFQGPLVFHGQKLLREGFNSGKSQDYITVSAVSMKAYNPDGQYNSYDDVRGLDKINYDPTGQFGGLSELARRGVHSIHYDNSGATELERNLGASHVMAFLTDRDHPESATLMMIYSPYFFDRVDRPALTMNIYIKLPTNQLFQLLKMIGANPDIAEQFYQVATAGLDQSVQRFKSSQVILVDLKRFMPLERFQHKNVQLHQMVTTYPKRLNPDGMVTLQYATPHGQIDRAEAKVKREAELLARHAREREEALSIQPKPVRPNPDPPLTRLINWVKRIKK